MEQNTRTNFNSKNRIFVENPLFQEFNSRLINKRSSNDVPMKNNRLQMERNRNDFSLQPSPNGRTQEKVDPYQNILMENNNNSTYRNQTIDNDPEERSNLFQSSIYMHNSAMNNTPANFINDSDFRQRPISIKEIQKVFSPKRSIIENKK